MDNSLLYKKVSEQKRLRKILSSQVGILGSANETPGKLKLRATLAELDAAFDRANGICEICLQKPVKPMRLVKDHCHNTGKFRGLLCNGCNTGIGMLGDSAELVERALSYLRR